MATKKTETTVQATAVRINPTTQSRSEGSQVERMLSAGYISNLVTMERRNGAQVENGRIDVHIELDALEQVLAAARDAEKRHGRKFRLTVRVPNPRFESAWRAKNQTTGKTFKQPIARARYQVWDPDVIQVKDLSKIPDGSDIAF